MKKGQVANFHGPCHEGMRGSLFSGQATDTYAYVWMVPGSLFSWITRWNLCQTSNRCKVAYMLWKTSWLLSHAMKEWKVANFHGQTSDVYAYAWMVVGSLFSWITLWNLCQTLNRCTVAYFIWKTSWLLFHAMKEWEVANFHGPYHEGMRGS
jgi:hypothetical protein